jgi:hypothetical protein
MQVKTMGQPHADSTSRTKTLEMWTRERKNVAPPRLGKSEEECECGCKRGHLVARTRTVAVLPLCLSMADGGDGGVGGRLTLPLPLLAVDVQAATGSARSNDVQCGVHREPR